MSDIDEYEMEILDAVGRLLISNLKGHDDVARSIFKALLPEFENHYPQQKLLTHIVLQHIKDDTENDSQIAEQFFYAETQTNIGGVSA